MNNNNNKIIILIYYKLKSIFTKGLKTQTYHVVWYYGSFCGCGLKKVVL